MLSTTIDNFFKKNAVIDGQQVYIRAQSFDTVFKNKKADEGYDLIGPARTYWDEGKAVYGVANTDTSDGSGIHWYCYYFDKKAGINFVYDSIKRKLQKRKLWDGGKKVIDNYCGTYSVAILLTFVVVMPNIRKKLLEHNGIKSPSVVPKTFPLKTLAENIKAIDIDANVKSLESLINE